VQIERLTLDSLTSGPKTTSQLRDIFDTNGIDPKYAAKVVGSGWLDLPRVAGAKRYQPTTVFHPRSLEAADRGLVSDVDLWLKDYMDSKTADPDSAALVRAAVSLGFERKHVEKALRRSGHDAYKVSGTWYRRRHGAITSIS